MNINRKLFSFTKQMDRSVCSKFSLKNIPFYVNKKILLFLDFSYVSMLFKLILKINIGYERVVIKTSNVQI